MRALARRDIARFFAVLGRHVPFRVTVVLTGGGEAMLLGGRRPTGDLDFGIHVPRARISRWAEVEAAIAATAAETGIAVQYSDDIDRWSSVSVPASLRRTRLLRAAGRVSVRLLDPTCWAVYKLARYLDADREDLVAVLRHERVSWQRLARLAGVSLRTSPRSTQLALFRRHVEHFFTETGRSVWGPRFDPAGAVRLFHAAASIPS